MMDQMVIHRFRGIREGVLKDMGKVNLLIGPNNAGKTAILEMLYLAGLSQRQCSLVTPRVEPSAWRAGTLVSYDFLGEEPMPRLRERHGESAVWKESPAVLTLEKGLMITPKMLIEHPLNEFGLYPPPDEPGIQNGFVEEDGSRIAVFRIGQQEAEVPGKMLPPFFDKMGVRLENSSWTYTWEPSWVYRYDPQEGIDYFAVWAIKGQLPAAEHVLLFDFHAANRHFNARFTQEAKDTIPDWYEKIAQSLTRVFPSFEGAIVEIDDAPGGQNGKSGYVRFPGKTRLAIDHFGDGARHAFKALAALIALAEKVDDSRPGLFLWEDPELFMHPASLERLLREVMQLVQNKPIQVFLSSQSLEVVGLLTHHFWQERPDIRETLRAFRLELDAGHLYVAKFHFENLYTWLEQGLDPRFWDVVDLPIRYQYREGQKLFEEDL